jgi:hypothetical protein
MRERQLRRRCRSLLRELDIRPSLDVAALCASLANYRGRPIRLADNPFPVPSPFGVWLAIERTDYTFYQRETSPAHQVHITLHEIGHLLADHGDGGAATTRSACSAPARHRKQSGGGSASPTMTPSGNTPPRGSPPSSRSGPPTWTPWCPGCPPALPNGACTARWATGWDGYENTGRRPRPRAVPRCRVEGQQPQPHAPPRPPHRG